jgi:hypothetical protein
MKIADPKLADAQQIAEALRQVDLIEDWCKAVRARAESMLLAGQEVPGFKLVAGKKGNRAWADAADAERRLTPKLGDAAYAPRVVVSPAQAEKLLKAKEKGLTLDKLGVNIMQSDGRPHVAPTEDNRPALTVSLAQDDFQDLG